MEANDLQQEVRALADQLAKEPFCKKYALDRQSLAKVNLFLEQRESSLERVAPEQEDLKESFRRFKAVWSLFLMQLGTLSKLEPNQLNTLALVDYLGAAAPEQAEEVTQLGRLTLVPTPPASTPPMVQELHASDWEPEGGDKTVMGVINIVDSQVEEQTPTRTEVDIPLMPMQPMMPLMPETPVMPGAPAQDPWDAQPITPTPPMAGESSTDWTVEATVEAVPIAEPLAVPARLQQNEAPIETFDEIELDANVDWSLPSDEEEKEETIRVRIPKAEPVPTVAAAQEYFATAGYFKAQRQSGSKDIAAQHLMRLEAQQICFAVELEFQERLAAVTPAFWTKRKAHLAPLWDSKSKKGDFHPDLVACWDGLVASSEIWSKQERLPVLTFRNSLRILSMTTDAASARLSPLEAGLWIFLFGQERTVGALSLHNALGLPTMDDESIAEAFLRLCRVHRLKSLLVNPSTVVTQAECDELRAHAEALFKFSQSWLNRSGSGS